MNTIVKEIPPEKDKSQRITLFFELLKNSDKKFNNPLEVHRHLRDCLNQIENEHRPRGRMTLFSFIDFRYHEQLKLYYQNSTKQHIFIHQKGGYGIYQINQNELYVDFDFYAKGNNRIIEVLSESGISLWHEHK